jgi:hypothetical protein
MSRSRTLIAVGIAASILAALPATAVAARVDQRSDHSALTAYRDYLQGIAARIPAVRQAESTYVSAVSSGCAGALNPLNGLSTSQVNDTAVFDFGEELGGSAFVVAYRPAHAPFATLAATLEKLPWYAAAQESAARGFANVLEKFETPADTALVASDNGLLRSLTAKLKGISTTGATNILNTLAG